MNRDRIDQMLIEYFQPAGAPAGLARDVIRRAGRPTARRRRSWIGWPSSATPRGDQPGPPRAPGAPARAGPRAASSSGRARSCTTISAGGAVFFSVPVDLDDAPEFQAKVLRARGRDPVRRGAALCLGGPADRPSRRGARGGHRAGEESRAAHRALPPRAQERRRRGRLHLRHAAEGAAPRDRAGHAGARGLHEHAYRVPRGLRRICGARSRRTAWCSRPWRTRGRWATGPAGYAGPRRSRERRHSRGAARGCRGRRSPPRSTRAATPPPARSWTRRNARRWSALYGDERRFRSRVDMARYRFGEGEYKYFADALARAGGHPAPARSTRALAPVANRWAERLGVRERLPGRPARARAPLRPPRPDAAHAAAAPLRQGRLQLPAPGSLRQGRVPAPAHRSCSSEPEPDFTGGEFVLVEQRPRAQSAAQSVPLAPRGGGDLHHALPARPRRARLVPRGAAARGERDPIGGALHARRHLPRRRVARRRLRPHAVDVGPAAAERVAAAERACPWRGG